MKMCYSAAAALMLISGSAFAQPAYSWRYYRPTNTGIQGDWNESIWIGPDNDPWIGGYSPSFEEGGIAKFVQGENRWINVSNVDYPIIGHPNDVGTTRVSDMVSDSQGNLWLGTWRGVMRMNLAAGAGSLVKYGPDNSALPGGLTRDMTMAPDGSLWVSAESTIWGEGGLSRYHPATNTWTHMDGRGGGKIAAQLKPGGGYYIWTSLGGLSPVERWDSTTNSWTSFSPTAGNPAALASLDSVDDAGNMWITRWYGDQGQSRLDCLRPDGTWVSPPLPPEHPVVQVAALRAFGNMQALMIDGYAHLHRFNGTSWTDLGPVPDINGFIDDLDIAGDGTIWLCGSGLGGALRRDASSGEWQRYRVTNTSQFDFFNGDLSIDPNSGDVYACANAAPGIGGMVRFDGIRWTCWDQYTYGLGYDWPFPTDNSEAVCVRASTGKVAVNPMFNFTHELDAEADAWTEIPGPLDSIRQYREDSLGRLWAIGHYSGLGYFQNGTFNSIGSGGWGMSLQTDPDRPGTVWANQDYQLTRTDGSYVFSRSADDFPGGGLFTGLAVDHNGIAWIGKWAQFTSTGSALLRVNANNGTYQAWEYDNGWPFPGEHVRPLAVTPDGRVWMTYDAEYPSTDMGLLWWDGTNVGTFPAPPNGEPQWGGLPHASVWDLEVKIIPGGYELWMSCLSRGIAVLKVTGTMCAADFNGDGFVNGDDYDAFASAFDAGDAAADFNHDGFVNGNDYDEFASAFDAGC
ncbi:MAG: hypothetical protein HUU19_00580 [Phycisphaerales bacterium]|nr:hypothetical protein [Phycisphaerales bacterium]